MLEGQIPTGAANSRIAALAARRRPTIDVNRMGIAIEAGGGGTPLLTNRAEALSDEGLRSVSQSGFNSPREAVAAALDAGGRTFRTDMIGQDLERARETKQMEYALAEDDAMAEQTRGNAVAALKARGEADTYFDPAVSRVRSDKLQQQTKLAEAQTSGTRAKADADVKAAELKAASDIESAGLNAGARALGSLSEIRKGLTPADPDVDGWLWDTVGARNDQNQIDQLDDHTLAILETLGLSGQQDAGAAPTTEEVAAPTPPQADDRTAKIEAFAQRHGIDPGVAERILVNRQVIPGAQ